MKHSFKLVLVVLMFGLGACSTTDENLNEPAQIFQDAEDDIENDHYIVALEKLRDLKNRFPYSKYSVKAQLRIADVYFLQESYGEAATAYESFVELHPSNEKHSYALFRYSESYYLDVPSTVARDMDSAKLALDGFHRYLKRFPKGPQSKEARTRVTQIRELLASKQHYIGDFYYKRSHHESAHSRFKRLIRNYPKTESAEDARPKLEDSKTVVMEKMEDPPRNEKGTVLFDIYRDGSQALEVN